MRTLGSRALLFSLFALPLLAQPTAPSEFLGYELGTRFTPHHRIVDYFDHLAAESGKVSIEQYGETWEGRPLTLAVITTESNQARIDEIRLRHRQLLNPRKTTFSALRRTAEEEPVVVWLAFGVHGNESSSSEAAMRVAWWAVSEAGEEILGNTILLIDPVQNPDGRERYVGWYHQTQGVRPNPNPEAVEHREQWPGGRYNHYLFDMNRDWAWATQPETRGRIAVYRDWQPQVVVDLHEMYYEDTYFFPPATSPVNTNIHPDTTAWLDRFGRENAEAFSEHGWPFFVGEAFDLFYPGYGDSWPSLRGSIGMTYEVGGHGAAGTIVETEDERLVTLSDRIQKHTTAAITTVRTASANAASLLEHTWNARARLLDDPTQFVIDPDSRFFGDLIRLLDVQGIEYSFLADSRTVRAQAVETARVVSTSLPAGALVIPVAQPAGGLVNTLFERSPEVSPEFLEKQRERVEFDESTEFYDITGWSLPLALNLDSWRVTAPLPVSSAARPSQPAGGAPPARYGWVLDGAEPAVFKAAGRLLDRQIRFGVLSERGRLGEREFARGSLVILRHENPDDVAMLLDLMGRATGASFIGFDSGWTGGLPLGSTRVVPVRNPQIALVSGNGVFPSSFGSLWWGLDAEIGIPHSVLRLDTLAAVDLDAYRVIVLPDGYGYAAALTEPVMEKLGSWVRGGGTLVAVGGAAAALRQPSGVSKLRLRGADEDADEDEEAEEPQRYVPIEIPGAVFRTEANMRSHYTMGMTEAPFVMVTGSITLEPEPHGAANIVTIAEEDPVVAGVVFDESREKVRGAAWMVAERVGRGRMITFADEPYFRGFWKGTLPLFLNSVLYTPSFL